MLRKNLIKEAVETGITRAETGGEVAPETGGGAEAEIEDIAIGAEIGEGGVVVVTGGIETGTGPETGETEIETVGETGAMRGGGRRKEGIEAGPGTGRQGTARVEIGSLTTIRERRGKIPQTDSRIKLTRNKLHFLKTNIQESKLLLPSSNFSVAQVIFPHT